MPTIAKSRGTLTLINVVTIEPAQQEQLVNEAPAILGEGSKLP